MTCGSGRGAERKDLLQHGAFDVLIAWFSQQGPSAMETMWKCWFFCFPVSCLIGGAESRTSAPRTNTPCCTHGRFQVSTKRRKTWNDKEKGNTVGALTLGETGHFSVVCLIKLLDFRTQSYFQFCDPNHRGGKWQSKNTFTCIFSLLLQTFVHKYLYLLLCTLEKHAGYFSI